MMDAFNKAIAELKNPYVKDWVADGKKVMGYTCSFTPGEIFDAVDIMPYRLRGAFTESMEIADTYYGPFACSYPKCVLQSVGEGHYNFLDGAIISTSCDSIRRLDDTWRYAAKEIPGILPEFFTTLDVPYKIADHAMDWYTKALRELIAKTQAHFNVSITDDKIKKTIELYNETRSMLAQLDDLRIGKKPVISGTEMYNVVLASSLMPRKLYNKHLKELIANLKKKKTPIMNGAKRVMVSGSICDDADLIELVEQSGAFVVAEGLCFGVRGAADTVSLEGDPILALSERYMQGSVCPRFITSYDLRIKYLMEKAKKANIEGILLENVRFCEYHGSENSILESAFEKIGVPAMKLEREHGPLTEVGRMRMRIDTFLNRI